MSEKEKMISGALYQPWSEELFNDRQYCKGLLHEFNGLSPLEKEGLDIVLKKIVKAKGELYIEQPFYCTYGYNIEIGLNFYAKVNLTIVDSGRVVIGNHVTIGPNVNIITSVQPFNEVDRIKGFEYADGVMIYDNACIGGGTTICPGVKISRGAIIEPGSVVRTDIPPYVIAGGNPCKVIREITEKDIRR